jgi:F0F1-type ATP synthase membrane subunit b/b'
MEKSIPTMFENSVNALLAKIGKWLLISVGVLLAVIILAVTRPILIDALDELHDKIENVEVIE